MKKKTKLLVVCGPTATGKTKLAIYLASKYNGEIISSDSRQVYRKMDIATGKDIDFGSKTKKVGSLKYYLVDEVRVWGYDLADPKDNFSVFGYLGNIRPILLDIISRSKLPIIVGGTGLYIKAVIDGIDTVNIPKDDNLRQSLVNKTKDELYERLAQMDPVKAGSMNYSDRNNPRRLIRAIEIAQWKIKNKLPKSKNIESSVFDPLFIGLRAKKEMLSDLIEKRSEKMIKNGLIDEIKCLLDYGINWNYQSFNTIGYKEWKNYFDSGLKNQNIFNQAKKRWIKNQLNFAKRQMTWFKKDKRINWLDVGKNDLQSKADVCVNQWIKKHL